MIPRTITARPNDDAFGPRTDPDIIPLPGAARRPEREPPAVPPATTEEFGPRDILNALRYHSVAFVTLGTLAAIGLGVAAWVLVPAKYTTYALIHVSQMNPAVIPSPADADNRGHFATVIKTEANKIRSTGTMLGALRDPLAGIAQLPLLRQEKDPVSFLEENVLTDFSETNQFIKVMLSGEDPAQITKIVNAIVDTYIKVQEVESGRVQKINRLATLEKNKQEYDKLLAEKMKHFDKTYGLPAGDDLASTKQRSRLAQYFDLQNKKNQYQMTLALVRERLKDAEFRLTQFDANPPTLPDLSQRVENDPRVLNQTAAVKKMERNVTSHVQQAKDPYGPRYKELKNQLNAEVAALESLKKQVAESIAALIRAPQREQLAALVEKYRFEIRDLEALERLNAKELETYKDLDADETDKRAAERSMAQSAINHLENEVSRIDRTMLALKTELDAPERVRIWQRAEVPQKSEIKKQAAVTGLAGFAGLGLVGGCFTVYELRRKRVYGPKDPLFRRLAVLGCVPDYEMPSVMASRSDGLDPAGRVFFEAVDKVKTVLCRQMQRRRMQALLVTSATPDEGKSVLAWHLALSLARTDKRTLFIDGNLRNPGLHNHFDIASHPGLSELLRGERPMPEVVQRTALNNLWCIAAGVCDDQARQALDKDALRRLLERARHDYDYVVIDTCSIREAVDPLYLAQQADATLLSVRTFQSCTTDVERACQRLTMLGTPLLGAVLIDASGAGCEL